MRDPGVIEKFFRHTRSMGYLAVVRRAYACPNRTPGETETFFTKRDADTILSL